MGLMQNIMPSQHEIDTFEHEQRQHSTVPTSLCSVYSYRVTVLNISATISVAASPHIQQKRPSRHSQRGQQPLPSQSAPPSSSVFIQSNCLLFDREIYSIEEMGCDSSEDLSRSLLVASNFIYLLPPLSLWLARRASTSTVFNIFDWAFVASSLGIFVASTLFHFCKDPDCTSWCVTSFIQGEYADSAAAFIGAIVFSFSGAAWSHFGMVLIFVLELDLLPIALLHLMGVSDLAYALVGVGIVLTNFSFRLHWLQFELFKPWWPYATAVFTLGIVMATISQYENETTLSYEYAHSIWHLATGLSACSIPWILAPVKENTRYESIVKTTKPKSTQIEFEVSASL